MLSQAPDLRDRPFLLADAERISKTGERLKEPFCRALLGNIRRFAEADSPFNPDCIAVDIDKKHLPLAFRLMSSKTRRFAISVLMLLTGDPKYVELCNGELAAFVREPAFYETRKGLTFGLASPETAAVVMGISALLDTFKGHADKDLWQKTARHLGSVSERLYEIFAESSDILYRETDWEVICNLAVSLAMSSMLLSADDERSGKWFAVATGCLEGCLDSLPDDGSNTGGAIRWQYSIGALCMFANALWNYSGADIRTHKALERTRRFPINLASPMADEITVMEDDVSLSVGRVLYGFASKALSVWFSDPVMGWGISRESAPGKWAQPEEILFMDYPAASVAPGGESVFYPRAGLAVLRSGYNADDMLISLKSTRSVSTPYGDRYCTQNDIQLFVGDCNILLNNGIAWSKQPNFFQRFRSEKAHNSIRHVGLDIIPETQGEITGFSSGDRVDSLTGKALYNYNGQEMPFYRSIVFIKPDIIVLYDNIAGRLAGSIEWLWHGSGSFLVNSLEKLQGFSIVDSANRKKLRVYLFKPDSWSYSIDTGYMLEDWVSGHESTHSVLSVKESYREKHTLLAVITGNENAIAGCRNHEERQHMTVDSGNMVFDLDYSGEILECASAQAK